MSAGTGQSKEAMGSAERVRRSRWVNKLEETADSLLEMLREAPEPLPRTPLINPELLERLFQFNEDGEVVANEDYEQVRFLELGNGHQASNKRRALACAARVLPGARIVDRKTIELRDWGKCHFAAYAHAKAAMISAPNRENHRFGSAEWHKREHIVLFRDAGDGRCLIYVCGTVELFEHRTRTRNGRTRHGVYWHTVSEIAKDVTVVPSADALKLEAQSS